MRILVACEFSGRVREAFRKLGHDAWSCDLLPSDDNSLYQKAVVHSLKPPIKGQKVKTMIEANGKSKCLNGHDYVNLQEQCANIKCEYTGYVQFRGSGDVPRPITEENI